MKITESIQIETEEFDPRNMPEIMGAVFDLMHQSEGVGYEPVKASMKTDTPMWKFAVLMRRKPCTPDEWRLTLEAIMQEAPF